MIPFGLGSAIFGFTSRKSSRRCNLVNLDFRSKNGRNRSSDVRPPRGHDVAAGDAGGRLRWRGYIRFYYLGKIIKKIITH